MQSGACIYAALGLLGRIDAAAQVCTYVYTYVSQVYTTGKLLTRSLLAKLVYILKVYKNTFPPPKRLFTTRSERYESSKQSQGVILIQPLSYEDVLEITQYIRNRAHAAEEENRKLQQELKSVKEYYYCHEQASASTNKPSYPYN